MNADTAAQHQIARDHDCISHPEHNTEWGDRVVTYLAGYVSHKLHTKLMCDQCAVALFASRPQGDTYSFIQRKSSGGLSYPSERECN